MAKQFDSLVELVKGLQKEPDVSEFLKDIEGIIKEAALFELLFPPQLLAGDRNNDEYVQYIHDYFDQSEKAGAYFLTPFPITAIEYQSAVYLLINVQDNNFFVVSCTCGTEELYQKIEEKSFRPIIAMIGKARIVRPELNSREITIDVKPLENIMFVNDTVRVIPPDEKTEGALVEVIMGFMHGVLYVMDADNFILRKENSQSRVFDNKKKSKGRDSLLRKTIMRPHYICLGEQETADFLKNTAKEPRPAHPVRGHWRRLTSEKFKNKQGQTIFIRQYFTGSGQIQSAGGWTYQVYVKPEFGKIEPV